MSKIEPFCYLVQTSLRDNPPHGWSVRFHAPHGVPVYTADALASLLAENERLRDALATVPSPPDVSDMEWAGKAALEDAQKENERLREELVSVQARADLLYARQEQVWKPELAAAQKDAERYHAAALFGLRVLEDAREHLGSYVDGGDIQDWALGYGMLKSVVATEECGSECSCYDFPTECYRYSDQTLALIRERVAAMEQEKRDE